MRRLAAWGAAILLPACCVAAKTSIVNSPTNQAPQPTIVEQLEGETPALVWWRDESDDNYSYDPNNTLKGSHLTSYCSAVWVSSDTMLTAEHCVDDINRPTDDGETTLNLQLLDMLQRNEEPKVRSWTPVGQPVLYSLKQDISPGQREYHAARVTAVDTFNDLALVKADVPGFHPIARIIHSVIHDGDEVHIVGHPGGLWWTYTRGYVAAERPAYKDPDGRVRPIMQVNAPVFFGNSGGGAFTVDGNLIGIADAISSSIPSVAFFIPQDVVYGFLVNNRILN